MEKTFFDQERYLDRIRYKDAVKVTEGHLKDLHRAQLFSIPFENFDILLGRGISLKPESIFHKLVLNPRGGYCFELNGLFLLALHHFGFEARPLLGRVHLRGTPTGRSHQVSLVTINGRNWLADVGFGGKHLPVPMPVEVGRPVSEDGETFRLIESDLFGMMLQTENNDGWQNLYSFDFCHVCQADITYGNHFTSTHPESFFTYSRIAALPSADGHTSLLDTNLTIHEKGVEIKEELEEGLPYMNVLRRYFGIDLDAEYEDLVKSGQKNGGEE